MNNQKESKAKITELKKLQNSTKYKAVIGFFVKKSLLVSNNINPSKQKTISIKDVLWVAEKLEPRVLEVLPAAILHYPKSFIDISALPVELDNIIKLIKRGEQSGHNYKHISYKTFKNWADFQPLDKRVKPESAKRITCSLRLAKGSYEKLKMISRERGVAMSRVADEMIEKL